MDLHQLRQRLSSAVAQLRQLSTILRAPVHDTAELGRGLVDPQVRLVEEAISMVDDELGRAASPPAPDALRDALVAVQRGLDVAKLGLSRDGVQHRKLVSLERIVAEALAAPAMSAMIAAAPTLSASHLAKEGGEAGAVDWRDMASAPRDASEIIVRMPKKGSPGHYRQIAHWAEGGGDDQPPFRGWFRYMADGYVELPVEPTGWMPLPQPSPALAEGGDAVREAPGRWSFDDGAIGWFPGGRSSLSTRIIARPPGLVNHQWYNHARDVCAALSTPTEGPVSVVPAKIATYDVLDEAKINALPLPLIARFAGDKDWLPIHDICIDAPLCRIDVSGKLEPRRFSEIMELKDGAGVIHNPDDFYLDAATPTEGPASAEDWLRGMARMSSYPVEICQKFEDLADLIMERHNATA